MIERSRGYRTSKAAEQREPIFFEVRLTDGSTEKIGKNFLRSFIMANKKKVQSYLPCN